MHELCRNIVFRVVHFQIECHLLIIWKYLLVMETPQGSDWMPIAPHWFQWPKASVGNVTWADEDLKNHALHFVSKLSFLFNMQLCGFHCINGYSICFLVIFPMYFY